MPDHLDEARDKLAAIRDGLAEKRKTMRSGECPGCGAFRLDGEPPRIHEHWCPLHGDAPGSSREQN